MMLRRSAASSNLAAEGATTTYQEAIEDLKCAASSPLLRRHHKVPEGCMCDRCQPSFYYPAKHKDDSKIQMLYSGHNTQAHDALLLARRAVKSFAGTKWRFGQLKAFADWRNWWTEGKSETVRRLRHSQDLSRDVDPVVDLRVPTEVFNQLFFCGALGEVRMSWGLKESHTYGVSQHQQDDDYSTILINPKAPSHNFNPEGLLCTILHEQAHVFLMKYSCKSRSMRTCNTAVCQELRRQNLGATGHGRAWQVFAQAIEMEMERLLGFKGRLGREECAVQEIESRGFVPSECDVKELYSSFDVLIKRRLERRWRDDSDLPQKTQQRKVTRRRSIGICQRLPKPAAM